jgi:hypothetical protein
MAFLEGVMAALGLKASTSWLAGLVGGGISAGVMPGPLAALAAAWKRIVVGAACGCAIAGFGAEPLAIALERPQYLQGVALGLGLFGLSAVFKLLKAWNDFDLGGVIGRIVDKLLGRFIG